MPAPRLKFGPAKYAALHLLMCRWLRWHAKQSEYRYVTLGGTELADIVSFDFVDRRFTEGAISYESDGKRHSAAKASVELLQGLGIAVDVRHDNFFRFARASEHPHVFFIDLEGVFAWSNYYIQMAKLFADNTMREGDVLFITSHLGHNPGWEKVFSSFDGEFRLLGAIDADSKKRWYRRAHPSFTLFKALEHANLTDDLQLKAFGCVEYRDTSPMGVYGFVVLDGRTRFLEFVRAADAPFYKPQTTEYCLGLTE